MSTVSRPRQSHGQRREQTTRRIVDAMARLLNDGERFSEVPVERVLEEAGVSRPTFYDHFSDKAALLQRLALDALEEIRDVAEQWWQKAGHDGGQKVAEAHLRTMIRTYRRHAPLLRAIAEASSYDDTIGSLWRDRLEQYIALTASYMEREQAVGIVAPDVDVEFTARVVLQQIDTAILDHVLHGKQSDDARLAQALARAGWVTRYTAAPPV